jgi:hypothetical protein
MVRLPNDGIVGGKSALISTCILLLVTGCGKPNLPQPLPPAVEAGKIGMERGDAAASDEIDGLLSRLRSDEVAIRELAKKDLRKLNEARTQFSLPQGMRLLKAATQTYPKDGDGEDIPSQLLELVEEAPRPEFIPLILESFERYGELAKSRAQSLLLKLETPAGDAAFMKLVRNHAREGRIPYLVTTSLNHKPRNPDIFFPELLEYASLPQLSSNIYQLCLSFCEAKLLTPDALAPFADQLLTNYRTLARHLVPAQGSKGIGWMWEDTYSEKRFEAGLLLDLMGYFPPGAVEADLRDGVKYRDPHLKCFALLSLLQLKRKVSANDVAEVAASAEMRNALYDRLKPMNELELYPAKYSTQAAFAESDMVHWLIYPTELARVPDEIELMKVVPIDTGLKDGIYDYYLFRFRTHEPHWAAKNGWMAGVSGPFARKDAPTTLALGETFSTFSKWDSKMPEELVGDIRALIDQWREYHLHKSKSK